jgi:hypothetical protein
MIDLLRQFPDPMTTAAIVSWVALLKRTDPESVKDLPAPNEIPSHLRALENARPQLARQNERGEWEAVPEKPAEQKPREEQKGLFDD